MEITREIEKLHDAKKRQILTLHYIMKEFGSVLQHEQKKEMGLLMQQILDQIPLIPGYEKAF